MVRGHAIFGVGEQVRRVRVGELIAFPAGQDHALLDASADLYLYAVGMEPKFCTEVMCGELPLPLHVKLGQGELGEVVARAAEIVDRPSSTQLGAELWQRVQWLAGRAAAREGRGAHVLTRRALEAIGAAPELGLQALARELRVHASEVSRHFHRDMGMTLVRYRSRSRLLRFIALVGRGSKQLTAAADEAGFGSYSQCHRAFEAELGCTPSHFFNAGLRESMQLAYVG